MTAKLPHTDSARKVLALAAQEAQKLGHEYVETHDLLIGLLKADRSVACEVLSQLGLSLAPTREMVDKLVSRGSGENIGRKRELSISSERVFQYAEEEAAALKHKFVGTEHLLLGLIREPLNTACQVLAKLGVQFGDVRTMTLMHLKPADVVDDGLLEKIEMLELETSTPAKPLIRWRISELGVIDPNANNVGEIDQLLINWQAKNPNCKLISMWPFPIADGKLLLVINYLEVVKNAKD